MLLLLLPMLLMLLPLFLLITLLILALRLLLLELLELLCREMAARPVAGPAPGPPPPRAGARTPATAGPGQSWRSCGSRNKRGHPPERPVMTRTAAAKTAANPHSSCSATMTIKVVSVGTITPAATSLCSRRILPSAALGSARSGPRRTRRRRIRRRLRRVRRRYIDKGPELLFRRYGGSI